MSDTPSEFTVMWPYRREEIALCKELECPRSVPWSFVEPHERQAQRFHWQTLKRLNERGGLSPCELVAVVTDRDYYELWGHLTTAEGQLAADRKAITELKRLLAEAKGQAG